MMPISIHALLAESDTPARMSSRLLEISIHALLAESDKHTEQNYKKRTKFLSTLSLRRATAQVCKVISAELYFYPRSPCGERQPFFVRHILGVCISIHALLAESDGHHFVYCPAMQGFLSTLSLRRATPASHLSMYNTPYFYPRSPCGERR